MCFRVLRYMCMLVCAKIRVRVFRQQEGLGLTVPINISIKAELSRRVEHLSSSQFTPLILSPLCFSLLSFPLLFCVSRFHSLTLLSSSLFFSSLPLPLTFRRYRNVFSSIHRVVRFSVAEKAFMCQESLLMELYPVLVDMSASLVLLPWVYLVALHTTAATENSVNQIFIFFFLFYNPFENLDSPKYYV